MMGLIGLNQRNLPEHHAWVKDLLNDFSAILMMRTDFDTAFWKDIEVLCFITLGKNGGVFWDSLELHMVRQRL